MGTLPLEVEVYAELVVPTAVCKVESHTVSPEWHGAASLERLTQNRQTVIGSEPKNWVSIERMYLMM